MYTNAEINEALRKFATWTSDDRIRQAVAEMIEAGEVEMVGIVDGEFVWRAAKPAAKEAA